MRERFWGKEYNREHRAWEVAMWDSADDVERGINGASGLWISWDDDFDLEACRNAAVPEWNMLVHCSDAVSVSTSMTGGTSRQTILGWLPYYRAIDWMHPADLDRHPEAWCVGDPVKLPEPTECLLHRYVTSRHTCCRASDGKKLCDI